MVFIHLIRFITGYVVFNARGGFPERFINLCALHHIPLWDVNCSGGGLRACTTIKGYRQIRPPARKSRVLPRIAERHGLPFFLHRYKRRAGMLAGAAADVKITLACFGLGMAWAVRKRWRTLAAVAGGGLFVLVPSYLWFGPPSITALLNHSSVTADNLYRIFVDALGHSSLPQLSTVALPVFAFTALLLMRRLPDGFPALPAVRPAFALSLAWLLTWPYQRPWYDAMAFCLLALYPASRLDWPLIARLVAGVLFSTPGMPGRLRIFPLGMIQHELVVFVVPAVRLGALVMVLLLCLTMAWQAREPLRLRLAGLVPLPWRVPPFP